MSPQAPLKGGVYPLGGLRGYIFNSPFRGLGGPLIVFKEALLAGEAVHDLLLADALIGRFVR